MVTNQRIIVFQNVFIMFHIHWKWNSAFERQIQVKIIVSSMQTTSLGDFRVSEFIFIIPEGKFSLCSKHFKVNFPFFHFAWQGQKDDAWKRLSTDRNKEKLKWAQFILCAAINVLEFICIRTRIHCHRYIESSFWIEMPMWLNTRYEHVVVSKTSYLSWNGL